jgi:acetyl esterase/lipase
LVRRFIEHSAGNTVEEVQAFTAQWVPVPHWVKVDEIEIADSFSNSAAKYIKKQLGPIGIWEAGGEKWWQWRKDYSPLKAEWIEMRQDYQARRETGSNGTRVLLYIHGGAYYFGSVDEHRYQMQRHARKLKARCLAPRYRLAPQFPFPCGLHDALTAYLFLLAEYDPKMIVVAGDSAGAGMVASLLVILRDQGLPQPAGAMLLSPWVDLTHSFPSICGDGKLDYIPTHGFIHRPSVAWPPPILQMDESDIKHSEKENANGNDGPSDVPLVNGDRPRRGSVEQRAKASVRPDWIPKHISGQLVIPKVELHGETMYIRDQLQLYAPNYQLLNPLVSPVLNPSLGGLCPLLIQVGGGELLRDEQIYFAHKAANPTAYPPNPEVMARYDPNEEILHKYSPTMVQLQVWDDVCHVTHTLAWTKPAKYMYRSVAQFGAWALARAQKTAIDIDEGYSTSGSDEETEYESADERGPELPEAPVHDSTTADVSFVSRLRGPVTTTFEGVIQIGKAGDPLPSFENHMIRQRVDRHGNIYPLGPVSMLAALHLSPSEIGVIKESPVHRWRERQEKWNKKFAREKAGINKQREEMEAKGMVPGMEGETPPPTALVRRWVGEKQMKGWRLTGGDERKKRSMGVGLKWWSRWGSKQDEETVRLIYFTPFAS